MRVGDFFSALATSFSARVFSATMLRVIISMTGSEGIPMLAEWIESDTCALAGSRLVTRLHDDSQPIRASQGRGGWRRNERRLRGIARLRTRAGRDERQPHVAARGRQSRIVGRGDRHTGVVARSKIAQAAMPFQWTIASRHENREIERPRCTFGNGRRQRGDRGEPAEMRAPLDGPEIEHVGHVARDAEAAVAAKDINHPAGVVVVSGQRDLG